MTVAAGNEALRRLDRLLDLPSTRWVDYAQRQTMEVTCGAVAMKIGRNALCPCGSGRKYKKCCLGKAARDHYVYIGHREPFHGIAYEDGRVSALLPSGEKMRADAVFTQTQYTRKDGRDKVLSRVLDQATFDVPSLLVSRFDAVFAIDTNTKRISDSDVSICCFLECYPSRVGPHHVTFSCRKHFLGFRNCPSGEAERFAWSKLVTMITSSSGYRATLRVGIITDHDLARHAEYNARALPIHGTVYLPNNFALIYASSEAGRENALNALVMECDKAAGSVLRDLEGRGRADVNGAVVTIDTMQDLGAQ